ncbi:MAG: hypothetical protein ACE5ES_02405 [Candidatus Nanoarchaeia archaeon]
MAEVKSVHEIIEEVIPYYKKKGEPEATHTLGYESYAETLEPVYFFIIDLLQDYGLNPEKLLDTFSDATGSPYFSETGMRMQRMQEEASKVMGTINTVLRSVLNIIYDLKEFRIRLAHYNDVESSDKDKKEAANLALKQIWMDRVDINKGNSSIKAMALGQAGFQTLLDAFLIANDEKEADKLDLNDRVKRIVKQRIQEFSLWLKQSEIELRKRYELERTYLKSQVNNLKLYARWAKPYLIATSKLESRDAGRDPELVKSFNRVIMELTILGKSKTDPYELSYKGDVPRDFQKIKPRRDYYNCVLVDFKFVAVPQQGNFIGKTTVTYRAYALNEDELNKIDQALNESYMGDVLKLIEGTTTESIEQLQEEINEFLEEESVKEESKVKDQSNPFKALIGGYEKTSDTKSSNEGKANSKKDKWKDLPLRKDDWIEKTHLRPVSGKLAADKAFDLFDIYKKAHGMPSYT